MQCAASVRLRNDDSRQRIISGLNMMKKEVMAGKATGKMRVCGCESRCGF